MSALDADEQLALLRRFEPELRFTAGELFLPMSVDDYVARSSLVAAASPRAGGRQGRRPGADELAARGTLTLDALAQLGREQAGRSLSLNHVERSLERRAYRTWRGRAERERFRASSRFAAVGLAARLVDIIMRLTLLLRGRVPGGFAAAAHQSYAASAHHRESFYYGHVTQDGGYTVLQYWYWYAMNDWRSTFGGVNDHEGDWEQVTIFLVPSDGQSGQEAGPLSPAWVAFSSHDEVGDDLRRRWDDPDLARSGEHPVVYVGAGSHSGAYLRGEYLVAAAIPLPGWLRRFVLLFAGGSDGGSSALSIPYIDYKRGDGVTIGPGLAREWTPVRIDDTTPWVRDFRGLWGLDTSDPFGGERAPAGPRYERNGLVRPAWGQPVAWAGLDKVAPTRAAVSANLTLTVDAVAERLADVGERLESDRAQLRGAVAAERTLGVPATRPGPVVRALTASVGELRGEQSELSAMRDGVELALAGELPEQPVHAHLRHRAVPIDEQGRSSGRLLRVWTAASGTVLLTALGVLMLYEHAPVGAVLWVAAVMLLIEAVVRRRVIGLLAGVVVIGLALAGVWAVVSLVLGNLQQGFGVLLLLGGLYLGIATLQESLRNR